VIGENQSESPVDTVAESLKKFWFETNLQKIQVTKAYSVAKLDSSGVESLPFSDSYLPALNYF
jgi:hypothetical protein